MVCYKTKLSGLKYRRLTFKFSSILLIIKVKNAAIQNLQHVSLDLNPYSRVHDNFIYCRGG